MKFSKEKLVAFFALVWKAIKTFFQKAWRWYAGLYRGAKWYKKCAVGFVSFIIAFILYLVAVNLNLFWLFGKSPTIHSIMNPETSTASMLYSADGVMIGKYFNENRTPVEYSEISPVFFKALIDTEDERFYSHHGIDFQGLFAAVKDMLGGKARGASTITQQLVKNMFRVRTQYSTGLLGKVPGLKIIIMKSKEWILAVELEMFYSKEEILTMYANTVDFGSNAYGIKTAAKTYFNVDPRDLNAEQSAVLVGLLKATSTYNPKLNPKNSLRRRNVVLQNMLSHGDLTKQQFDSISALPIDLNFRVENAYDGQALYFRQAVAAELREWCRDNGYDLYGDGLKIYTTIDTRLQKYAEEAAIKHMRQVQNNFRSHWGKTNPWQDEMHREIPGFIEDIAKRTDAYKKLAARYPDNPDSVDYYMNKPHRVRLFDYDGVREDSISSMDSIRYMVRFMHTAFVAMEPQTGHVKAWVGDIDFRTWKYDKVTAKRQPGSTFKLFVYTASMNSGLAPCDRRVDSWLSLDVTGRDGKPTKWSPRNANGVYSGDSLTLKSAFAQSINTVAVKLGMEVGIPNVISTAHDMGIKSKLDNAPALSLGASDVNLLELVNAYCCIADDGMHHDPVLVTRIEDSKGNTIYTATDEHRQAIPYRSAFLMQQMLMAGMREPGGTSMALWGYVGQFCGDTDFGGKTGSSSNYSDAWFVGVSPALVVGAWVGGEYRCIHFRNSQFGQGSRAALPLCGYFLQSVMADERFRRYHRKFGDPKEPIPTSEYGCAACWKEPVDSDSLSFGADSIFLLDKGEEIILPEEELDNLDDEPILDDDDRPKTDPSI